MSIFNNLSVNICILLLARCLTIIIYMIKFVGFSAKMAVFCRA